MCEVVGRVGSEGLWAESGIGGEVFSEGLNVGGGFLLCFALEVVYCWCDDEERCEGCTREADFGRCEGEIRHFVR